MLGQQSPLCRGKANGVSLWTRLHYVTKRQRCCFWYTRPLQEPKSTMIQRRMKMSSCTLCSCISPLSSLVLTLLPILIPSSALRGHKHFLAPAVHRKADQKGVWGCVYWRGIINDTQAIFCITPPLCPPPCRWGFRGCFRLLITSPITIRWEMCNLPRRKKRSQSIVSVAFAY